ncbi:argininosuccinate lyase [Methanosarcina sp. KYL-1]|uniref:argininosuccinate lyase n=1 Tax=Methanosarcina sp. KYL-1 TaxID=2602068 RepID=UPI0021015A50|nr:argininosuccinate lyase [Methanosarcina sp. KYL-1]MCQ1536941.1 argininosuccinate lyase [Methanosarcina sp. KYL-1]
MSNILRRGRLEAAPDEEILRYTSSMEADRWIFYADIAVDLAHTVMLKEQGIIRGEDCSKILSGLLKVREEGMEKLDFSYEDIHISLESRLIDMVGEEVGGRMHSGRSRNDEVATCIRLALRDELLGLLEELFTLRKTFLALAEKHTKTLMPGFTHLQHAQPTTLAHHLSAHESALSRDFDRVLDAFSRVNLCPLGAAAFASTGFSLNRKRTQELLGFAGMLENSMDAVSSRDFLIECASVFANLMINLSRMAEELVVWSSSEFNFIELDDTYASTSSIMPQKKNPDTAELMRGKTGVATGALMSLLTICKGLPLSYNRDLQEATPNIWRSAETVRASVRVMEGMARTMKVHPDVLAAQSVTGFTTATELADTFVRETGIPFRTAHQLVGVLARDSEKPTLEKIDSIAEVVLGESLSDRGLTEKMVREALNPVSNIERRKVPGGPAPEEMQRYLGKRQADLELNEQEIATLKDSIDSAFENLLSVVEEYRKD